jgi:hypothetical protein
MKDYIQLALRTESTDNVQLREPRLMHAAVGIMTELVELCVAGAAHDTVNACEEVGDVFWYSAIACDTLECTFEELILISDIGDMEDDDIGQFLFEASADLLDQVKRNTYYGTKIDPIAFGRSLGNVLKVLFEMCREENWSVSEIQERNIEKLRVRFPEKFNQNDAENRNLDAEREVLS